MTGLGNYPGVVVVRAFENAGWHISRQKGSHVVMEKAGHDATLHSGLTSSPPSTATPCPPPVTFFRYLLYTNS
jgi:hypothetical protein